MPDAATTPLHCVQPCNRRYCSTDMCCWRSADLKLDSALHSPLGFQSLTNWRSTAPAEVPSFNHSPFVQLPPGCALTLPSS
eukprot:scaffold48129_cov88-Phaeocystis_antarctica.AAC.2